MVVPASSLRPVDDEGDQIGYKILPKGTPVVTSDDVTIGTVAEVLDNAREHIFDGIVVKTDGGRVFVDAPEVKRIAERRVTLTIDAAEAAQLPAHSSGVTAAPAPKQGFFSRLFGAAEPCGTAPERSAGRARRRAPARARCRRPRRARCTAPPRRSPRSGRGPAAASAARRICPTAIACASRPSTSPSA